MFQYRHSNPLQGYQSGQNPLSKILKSSETWESFHKIDVQTHWVKTVDWNDRKVFIIFIYLNTNVSIFSCVNISMFDFKALPSILRGMVRNINCVCHVTVLNAKKAWVLQLSWPWILDKEIYTWNNQIGRWHSYQALRLNALHLFSLLFFYFNLFFYYYVQLTNI